MGKFNIDEAIYRIDVDATNMCGLDGDSARESEQRLIAAIRAELRAAVLAGREEAREAAQNALIKESIRLTTEGVDNTPLHGVPHPLSLSWACAAEHARATIDALPEP